jgi:hypothetical protein
MTVHFGELSVGSRHYDCIFPRIITVNIICSLFNDAASNPNYIKSNDWIVNHEWKRSWKEAIVT